jgi:hypothetical protein
VLFTCKKALITTPILYRPDFNKVFILDVDWSFRGVGAILSEMDGHQEHVITYASKGMSLVQKCFHPIEGKLLCSNLACNVFQTIFALNSFYSSH